MRISKKAKQETDCRILKAAEKLFLSKGYEDTTTRDIASSAGIATGTLFNYYKTKESLAMRLVYNAMLQGQEDFTGRKSGEEEIGEEIFMIMTGELRRLRPYRSFIGPVLESGLSLFIKNSSSSLGESLRLQHLHKIEEIVNRHGCFEVPFEVAASLYWSLYLGILAHWCRDESDRIARAICTRDRSRSVSAGGPIYSPRSAGSR